QSGRRPRCKERKLRRRGVGWATDCPHANRESSAYRRVAGSSRRAKPQRPTKSPDGSVADARCTSQRRRKTPKPRLGAAPAQGRRTAALLSLPQVVPSNAQNASWMATGESTLLGVAQKIRAVARGVRLRQAVSR